MSEATESPKAFHAFESSKSNRSIHVYISKEIGEPEEFVNLIHQIRTTNAGDIVYVFLNTPGGYLDTAVQLINAFKSTQAKIVTVLDGTVASAGTLLFLAGDEYIVHEHGQFMIHNYSGGVWGKGHEQVAQLVSTQKSIDKLMRHYYDTFLSDAEFERVKAGEDLWFSSEDVKKRLLRVVKQKRKNQVQASNQAKKSTPSPKQHAADEIVATVHADDSSEEASNK